MTRFRSILEEINIFPQQQYFRFNRQNKYSNCPAILCSIIVWMFLIVLLIIGLVNVSRGDVAYSSISVLQDSSISDHQVRIDGNKFMIALETTKFIANKIVLNLTTYNIFQLSSNGSSSISQIHTQKCTLNHFQGASNIESQFSRRNMSNWDCFPQNSSIHLGINEGNSASSFIRMLISCPTCTSQTIAQVYIHIMTPNINPGSKDYLTYSINSQNYVILQPSIKSYLSVNIGKYSLENKDSSFPWSQSQEIQGSIIKDSGSKIDIYQSNSALASGEIKIYKSSKNYKYSRKSQNFLAVFAFIGGIFVFLYALLFIFRWISEYFLDMAMAQLMYHDKKSKNYSVSLYIAQQFLSFIKMIGCQPHWQKTEHLNKTKQKIQCLRDTIYLEYRINFLQMTLPLLLEQHQIKALYLATQPNIYEAYQRYQLYQTKKQLIQYLKLIKIKEEKSRKKSQDIFGPNCQISAKKSDSSGRRNGSGSSQDFIRSEFPMSTQMNNELVNSSQQKYNKNVEEYLSSQGELQEVSTQKSQQNLQQIVRMTKSELQLLQMQAFQNQKGKNNLSRKIYDRLVQNDKKLVELMIGIPKPILINNKVQLNPEKTKKKKKKVTFID